MFAQYEALEALGQSKLIKDQPMLGVSNLVT